MAQATLARLPEASLREPETTAAEEKIAIATQWQLMWWRFRKHRLAMIGGLVLIVFYLMAIFAASLAYVDPNESEAQRSLLSPQPIHWFDNGEFKPYVNPLKGTRDPKTFKRVYVPDLETKVPVKLFGHGYRKPLCTSRRRRPPKKKSRSPRSGS